MKPLRATVLICLAALGCAGGAAPAQEPAPYWGATWRDRLDRATASPEAWARRCAEIRRQILVSSGLWPEFERPPLQPLIWGRLERDGYSVEKFRAETLPGFHLTGNLYRPLGKAGPHPAVLSMHGHWKNGRFEDQPLGSIAGRAIGLARLGFVVLSTDMVGYGDLKQLPHKFSDVPWGLTLQGLQLWNNLRSMDWLSAQADIDPRRIGATGASGGGTQTFLLTAVDARVACSAPVNMVAAGCQGGCLCENAPLLRLDLNNVEIAAACAPRPLLLPACTGDWTADTPALEGPALEKAFAALGMKERFRWVQMKADHNYNQDTREAVYAWFARWLLGRPDAPRLPEAPFKVEKTSDLTAIDAERPLPPGAADDVRLAETLRSRVKAQLESFRPTDAASLDRFRAALRPAFAATIGVDWPEPARIARAAEGDSVRLTLAPFPGSIVLRRAGSGEPRSIVVVADAASAASVSGPAWVLVLGTHERETPCNAGVEIRNKGWVQWRENHPLAYYRTEPARQAIDVLTAVAAVGGPGIALEGRGAAGAPVLIARALIPAGRIGRTEADWTAAPEIPGILRLGGLSSAAALAAPGELVLRGASAAELETPKAAYRAAGAEAALR
jgi:dienelactone hydrolase